MRMQILRFALAALALLACAPAFGQALPDTLRSAGVTVAQWDAVQAEVRRVAQQRNVSQAALEAVAQALGLAEAQAGGGRVDVGRLIGAIQDSADRLIELEAQLARLQADEDPVIAALVGQARDAIAAGDLASADAALAQARQARRDRNALRQAQLEAGLLDEAEIIATQGSVATLRGDWLAASALYQEAYETAPESATEARWRYAMGWGQARLEQGLRSIGRNELSDAIIIFRDVAYPLAVVNDERLELAATYYWWGRAETVMLPRGGSEGAARAITQLETATQLLSFDENPVEWGNAHNALGIAYNWREILGGYTPIWNSGLAFGQALRARTLETDPYGWARTQMNLGWLYLTKGRYLGEGSYHFAIESTELALTVITPDTAPYEWSLAQQNLGLAYYNLGRLGRAGSYAQAISYFEASIAQAEALGDEYSWAQSQAELATTFEAMAVEGERHLFREAVHATEQVLAVVNLENNPGWWLRLQIDLARRLAYWGEAGESGALERSVAVYESVLLRLTPDNDLVEWRFAIGGMADAWRARGRGGEVGAYERAIELYLTELPAWEPDADGGWEIDPLLGALGWATRARAIAATYVEMGEPAQAEALVQDVLNRLTSPEVEVVAQSLRDLLQSIRGSYDSSQ